jgi:SAM-dependent methyltransferase
MKFFRKNDFNPDVFHPYYFIRKCLREKIQSKAPLLKGRLLDFGCGAKPYQSFFTVDEYIGVDFENEGHSHDYEDIDVFYDGKTIPFPDQHFDSILTTEVFEHVFNLPELLTELNRVLKPGGMMLVTCPFVWNEHEVPNDYARYSRFAMEDLLTKNGFTVQAIEKSGNFIVTLFQLYCLYFFQTFYFRLNKFFLLRWFMDLFFIALPNITGLVLNKILPKNDSLYLNNVILAYRNR